VRSDEVVAGLGLSEALNESNGLGPRSSDHWALMRIKTTNVRAEAAKMPWAPVRGRRRGLALASRDARPVTWRNGVGGRCHMHPSALAEQPQELSGGSVGASRESDPADAWDGQPGGGLGRPLKILSPTGARLRPTQAAPASPPGQKRPAALCAGLQPRTGPPGGGRGPADGTANPDKSLLGLASH